MEKITVWITKYALTGAIVEAEGELRENIKEGQREWVYVSGYHNIFYIGTECAYTKEEALELAEEMRLKRIESLKKQIAKLGKKKGNFKFGSQVPSRATGA